jgi:endonuclease V-like protein UPF0215 family
MSLASCGPVEDETAPDWQSDEYKIQRHQIKNAISVDIRGASKETRLQVVSIQGLVNRAKPTIFVLDESSNEERWQKLLEKHLGIVFTRKTADELIREYAPVIGKQVLYSLQERHSVNVATTIAGIESAILTHQDLGVPTVFDTRGKWSNVVEASRWSASNLLPKVSKEAIGYASEDSVGTKDFAIARRLFNVQLDTTNRTDHINLFKEILSNFPTMTPLFGYPSPEFVDSGSGQDFVTAEVSATVLFSSKGKVMIPTDGARNLSFLAGLAPRAALKQNLPGDITYDKNKRYVSLIVSDGDNFQYIINRMREHWEKRQSSSVPLGWTMAPSLAQHAPIVLDVYYKEASAKKLDEFIAGPSGYGYVYPSYFNDTEMREFAKKTREATVYSNMRSIFVLDKRDAAADRVRQFMRALGNEGSTAVFFRKMEGLGDGDGLQGKLSFMSSSQVIYGGDVNRNVNDINDSARKKPFSMVYLDTWGFNFADLERIRGKVDKNIVFVLPSQLMNLYRKSRGEGPTPGLPPPPAP